MNRENHLEKRSNKMKQVFAFTILLIILSTITYAQNDEKDFVIMNINKQVNEYLDHFDLSSPINSFITFKYLQSEGKQGLYRSVNSYKYRDFFPKENTPDAIVQEETKEKLLNTKINEIVIYKDSVAGIITDPPAKSTFTLPMQIITYLTLEEGKWLNAGENLGNDIDDALLKFKEDAPKQLEKIHQIIKLKNVSKDTASFVNYLKENSKEPKQFMLQSLAEHKIVVYGELHRREASWELMKIVIDDPNFSAEVGTVFMELSSDKQAELDSFFNKEVLDKEIILNIFRDVQINGWYDKGMYEFLLELWTVNKNLPIEKRIKVIAVDEPRPFRTFKTGKEMENYFKYTPERNDQMAEIILQTIKSSKDKRNNLFIVGLGHAFKSIITDMAIGSKEGKMKSTAASQITAALPEGQVFTIFQHIPIIDNHGHVYGKLRNGIFDYALSATGNKPVAFNLKNSPFGKEPFDALFEVSYNKMIGNYEDNYDAYIFLGPLETEQSEYLFYDILTDDYVKELERRATMTNTTVEKWFGVSEATKEAIIEKLKSDSKNNTRWTFE